MTYRLPVLAALISVGVTACAPPLARVISNREILPSHSEEVVQRARVEGEIAREQIAEQRGAATAAALASCAPSICDAIARGEVALGMSEAQVLAATRTTGHSWDTRQSGGATLMTARPDATAPADAVAPLAFVNIQNGQVASYTYREPHGFRTVATAADATSAGRAAAQADAMLREGDSYVAAGDLARALDRYDRADILRPAHAETNLRIATTLDKQLRPFEAVLRYRMFIHQMELERLYAEGEVAARIAEAIARAHERIVVIERR